MSSISRRDSLKYITLASISAGVIACDPTGNSQADEHQHPAQSNEGLTNLSQEDLALLNQVFFTDHERETVRLLANIIIPADEKSGSAEEAGIPKFIEFMMLDQPKLQVAMRGGLKWLDLQAMKRYGKTFVDSQETEKIAIVDDIAYPDTASPEFSQGVSFFNRFRDFVATGFYTSKIGIEDLQYIGNRPSVWNGPPKEWLERLGVNDLS